MTAVQQLTELAARHHAWVDRMGWHNKTTLETLGLIGTEIVEAQEQILLYQELPLNAKPSGFDEFWAGLSEELAERAGPTIWKSRLAENAIAELLIDWKQCMNAARKAHLDEDFMENFGKLVRRVMDYAEAVEFDLIGQVKRKMALNAENGTRGRVM